MTMTASAAPPGAVASKSAEGHPQAEQSKLGWSFLAKVAAAFSAIGGLCLPLVGASTHAHYYREWGLDAAMFPIAADMTFVYGYEALVHGFSESLLTLIKDYWHVLLGYGLLCVVTMLMVVKGSYYRGLVSVFLQGRDKAKGVLRLGVACLVAMALPTVAIPFAAISVLLVLVLPLSAAESYAKDRVSRQIKEFKVGCEMSSKIRGAKCLEALKEGQSIGHGFLIGSSGSHVALFDPTKREVRLLERAGATIVSGPRPIPHPAGELP